MYTVLLVDDEENVLKNLLNTIDWPAYGVETVITACDGLDALSKMARQPVDLLITDISMPHLDGIGLIHQVREISPLTRCVILSSYSDFTYAQEAISLGVENYLLKPFKTEELENSVKKSLDNLFMHKHVMQTLFLDNMLYRWVSNDISTDELSDRSKHGGVNIYLRNYCVVLIKSMRKNSLDTLLSAFLAFVKPKNDAYHFINYDGYHVFIIGGHSITQEFLYDALCKSMGDAYSHIDFQAAIGHVVEGCEEVSQSYQSALECLLLGRQPITPHFYIADKKISLNLNNMQINRIIDYLQTSTSSEESGGSSDLFHELLPDWSSFTLNKINSYVDAISSKLALQLCASGLIDTNARDTIVSNTYHFEEFPSEEELLRWFSNTLYICQALIRKHTKALSPIILSAMQYISDNYSEHVSIKDFCIRHNMNASYLGLVFKKETGIYFNDYINQIRINKAIHLMKTTNHKVAEICRLVGFTNTSYFILCFKKQTGVSPAKFRQLHNSV